MTTRAVAATLLAAVAVAAAPAAAASLALTNGEREQALAVGQRSITSETFDQEWRVTNSSGESLMVITPFHRLVLAARQAAFKNERLRPNEPERIMKDHGDRLVFWAQLRGGAEGFARFYAPRLLVGERQVSPTFVQNERTALPTGNDGFVARCVYAFPTKDLDGKSRLVLAVSDGNGREVTRFTIDLGSMR